MKKLPALCTGALLSLSVAFALAQQAAPSQQAPSPAPATQPAIDISHEANVAVAATPATSFVSGNETLSAINDGFRPRNSRDHSHDAYGNWPRTGTQWVEYDWSKPISTNASAVYWWQDGQGIHLPTGARLEYWDGSANKFVPVPGADVAVAPDRFNTTTFPEITTTKIRLSFDGDARDSTGILEWQILDSGKSPAFPPVATAGPSRDVVGSGKTFLAGKVKAINTDNFAAIWSKDSGPGDVSFDDAHALTTAAAFSAPGDYTLKLTATAPGSGQSSSDTLSVHVDAAAPADHLDPVYTTSWKLNSPLWNSRIKGLIVNWIPHCMAELSDLNLKEGGINNFIQAGNKLAGKPYTPHVGYPFADAYTHNTVEAMSVALMVDPQGDPDIIKAQDAMRAKLNEWIPLILAAQESDGYLQTRFTQGTPAEYANGTSPGHWNPRTRGEHEGYTAGYFLESAIANYLATGGKDLRLYNAAKKLADCWCDNLGPAPKKPWYDGHEEMEQALVRFGRFVNDQEGGGKGDKYVALAKFLLDCRGAAGDTTGPSAYDQSLVPLTQQYAAMGHAVRAAYCYSGMADVAMQTHDPAYESAVQSIWDDLTNRQLYVTGGIGSGETSEGFGRDYSLPNSAYCESCSGCGELFFQYKMNLTWHDAKYADLYETTLYNAILGDMDLTGQNFTYTNPLDSSAKRYLWHNCPCCVGNFPRTLLMLPTWMYAKSADALYVNLFVGSTVHIQNVAGTDMDITQTTDYPWKGEVAITLDPSAEKSFALKIRIPQSDVSDLYKSLPAITTPVAFTVNGEKVDAPLDHGYATITRTWKPGDKIAFTLPLEPQRITPSDKIAADRGKVALRYGPLVYNIEAADNQNLNDALGNAPLTAEFNSTLLDGVMTLKTTFADNTPLLAIPNYARQNRGGRSLVWINAAQ